MASDPEPRISGINFIETLEIRYQWLVTKNAAECPCSDCREAREISSMDKLYPDGRIKFNNAE